MSGFSVFGGGYQQPRKRKVFFSFHYADIMRVNNIRKSGEFGEDGARRAIEGFYDFSLWEKKKSEGDEATKRLIRDGVYNTSAVCVLIGSDTWKRPWVRYEIARSVVDDRGLLGVHINGIKHHQPPYSANELGEDPCKYLGIARREDKFFLCERKFIEGNWVWKWYDRYTNSINVPKYMPQPAQGSPLRLSQYAPVYNWTAGGAKNIGAWIDKAAQSVGR